MPGASPQSHDYAWVGAVPNWRHGHCGILSGLPTFCSAHWDQRGTSDDATSWPSEHRHCVV